MKTDIVKAIDKTMNSLKTYKSKSTVQHVSVVTGLKTNLLGLPAITALKLATRVDSATSTLTEIREKFPQIFKGLGNLGELYKIKLKPDAKPYALFTPRHIPLWLRAKVNKEHVPEWKRWELSQRWTSLHHGVQEWLWFPRNQMLFAFVWT